LATTENCVWQNGCFPPISETLLNNMHKCSEPPTVAVQSSASEVHCEMSALPFRIKNSGKKHIMQVFHCRIFAAAIWQHKLMCCGVPQGESADEPLKAATVPLAIGNCTMKIGDNDRQ
jgi:hypothetical protein